jgi:methylated-DNA-[protein]-cysteine S-methyltransferase
VILGLEGIVQPNAFIDSIECPLGVIHFAASQEGLIALMIGNDRAVELESEARRLGYLPKRGANRHTEMLSEELCRYFAGTLQRFDTPVVLHGTPFQARVWETLRQVPSGGVLTYGELAERAGSPKSARAVGAAMARNRIPIVVPCHRVIASGGGLGGFTGGLEIKRALLQLEGVAL